MKKSKDRSSKKCFNPWFHFLSIFFVAAFTLFVIFEVDKDHIKFHFSKSFHKEESEDNILIAAAGDNPKSYVAVQFETSHNFIVVKESTGEYECFSNYPTYYNKNTVRDFIRQQKIETVIAGTMEIGTYRMLNSFHVEVFTGVTGTVEEALRKYKKHELVSFSRHYYNRQLNTSLNNTGNPKSVRRVIF